MLRDLGCQRSDFFAYFSVGVSSSLISKLVITVHNFLTQYSNTESRNNTCSFKLIITARTYYLIYHNIIPIILGYSRGKSKAWAISQSPVSVLSFKIMSSAVCLTVLSLFGTASYSSVQLHLFMGSVCGLCACICVFVCVYVRAHTHVYVCVHMLRNMCRIRGWFIIAQFFNFLLLLHKL